MHPTLPGCFGDAFIAVNGALWTIKIELAFYILLPVLMWFLKKLKSAWQVNLVLAALYVLSVIYAFVFHRYAEIWHLPKQLANQFPAFVSCFVCGIFCLFNLEWIIKKLNILIIPSIFVFALHYISKTEFLMPLSLCVICMFFAFRFTALRSIGEKIDYSYPMYLFHFPLIQLMTHFAFYKNCFPLAVVLTFAGIFFISYFIEELPVFRKR